MLPHDRWFAAYDDDRPVGTTTSFPFRLTVPGGELAAGGVTWVGVLPSHRRRGILRELMQRQLDRPARPRRAARDPLRVRAVDLRAVRLRNRCAVDQMEGETGALRVSRRPRVQSAPSGWSTPMKHCA